MDNPNIHLGLQQFNECSNPHCEYFMTLKIINGVTAVNCVITDLCLIRKHSFNTSGNKGWRTITD